MLIFKEPTGCALCPRAEGVYGYRPDTVCSARRAGGNHPGCPVPRWASGGGHTHARALTGTCTHTYSHTRPHARTHMQAQTHPRTHTHTLGLLHWPPLLLLPPSPPPPSTPSPPHPLPSPHCHLWFLPPQWPSHLKLVQNHRNSNTAASTESYSSVLRASEMSTIVKSLNIRGNGHRKPLSSH